MSDTSIGSVAMYWWEDDKYRARHGDGVIVASSRTARTLTDAEATEILGGPITRHDNYRRITQWDRENEFDCEEGDWSGNASGAGWITVAIREVRDE